MDHIIKIKIAKIQAETQVETAEVNAKTAGEQTSLRNEVQAVRNDYQNLKQTTDSTFLKVETVENQLQKLEDFSSDPLLKAGAKAAALNSLGVLGGTTLVVGADSGHPFYVDSPTGTAAANEGLC